MRLMSFGSAIVVVYLICVFVGLVSRDIILTSMLLTFYDLQQT